MECNVYAELVAWLLSIIKLQAKQLFGTTVQQVLCWEGTIINTKQNMGVCEEKRKFLRNFYHNCFIFTLAYRTLPVIDSKSIEVAFQMLGFVKCL